MREQELILYKHFKHEDILTDMSWLLTHCEDDYYNLEDRRTLLFDVVHRLVELAGSHGYEGNLWHTYLTYLLANNENAFSMASEIKGAVDGSINQIAMHDFGVFKEFFDADIASLDRVLGTSCVQLLFHYQNVNSQSKMFNKRVRDRICELSVKLAHAENPEIFLHIMSEFYKDFGVGKFGLHKAFRIVHKENGAEIVPITNIAHVYLEDLIGYESAKQKLVDNTEAFVNGKKANNCLLFGDAGTGKSSSIKGILNRYYDKGLRIIEVYKHQFQDLNDIIAQIKTRNYKFIIYMDDLSFEDFEIEYKYLKAVIEGGLEKKPDNVLIYATSNRRHLVREKFSDKEERRDDLHSSDTVQEKLSLYARFGVSIFFCAPDKKEFDHIVVNLAERYGIEMPKTELLEEANKWELYHGGLSGRTAQQFIDYLLGKQ
ncbi:MAG: DUF815 domain-containing protein [Clostridia bacterium]|nr:DUF815 domain-containing protein [Clostridia bacterium]